MIKICLPCWILIVAALAGAPACRHTPPTITTPQGTVAYQIEDLVAAVGVIQHAAIVANRAGKLSRPTALKVTRGTRAMARTLDSAIDAGTGTQALYRDVAKGLAEMYADPDLARFKSEIVAAQAIVAAFGGM